MEPVYAKLVQHFDFHSILEFPDGLKVRVSNSNLVPRTSAKTTDYDLKHDAEIEALFPPEPKVRAEPPLVLMTREFMERLEQERMAKKRK